MLLPLTLLLADIRVSVMLLLTTTLDGDVTVDIVIVAAATSAALLLPHWLQNISNTNFNLSTKTQKRFIN